MKFKAQKTVRWDKNLAEYYHHEILARLLVGNQIIGRDEDFARWGEGGWARIVGAKFKFPVDSHSTFTLPGSVQTADTMFFIDYSSDLAEVTKELTIMRAYVDYQKAQGDPVNVKDKVVACVFGTININVIPPWTKNLPKDVIYISTTETEKKYVYRLIS